SLQSLYQEILGVNSALPVHKDADSLREQPETVLEDSYGVGRGESSAIKEDSPDCLFPSKENRSTYVDRVLGAWNGDQRKNLEEAFKKIAALVPQCPEDPDFQWKEEDVAEYCQTCLDPRYAFSKEDI